MDIIDQISVERNGIYVIAAIISVQNDYLITVTGGDKPHIGALSFGNNYEENNIALKGHKELTFTRKMFLKLKNLCNGNILIAGGIHIDNISAEQIRQVLEICDVLTEKIAVLFDTINSNKTVK